MNDRRFDLVMFDLDGTLVETAPEITDAVNDTLRQFGWAEIDEAQVARWIGYGTGALLVEAVARATGTTTAAVQGSERLAAIGTVYERWYSARSSGFESVSFASVSRSNSICAQRASGASDAGKRSGWNLFTRAK